MLLLFLDSLIIFNAEVFGDGDIIVILPLDFRNFCEVHLEIGVVGDLFDTAIFRALSLNTSTLVIALLDQKVAIFHQRPLT